MRLQNIILTLLALLLSSVAVGQQMRFSNASVEKLHDRVVICFDAKVDKIPTNKLLILTPVLWDEENKYLLPEVVVIGRNKAISESRKEHINTAATIIKNSNKHTTMSYQATIPFEPWMKEVSLSLNRLSDTYYAPVRLNPIVLLSKRTTPSIPPIPISEVMFRSDVSEMYASEFPEMVKDYPFVDYLYSDDVNKDDALVIYFKQGSSVIDELYMDNWVSLNEMRAAIRLITTDKSIVLSRINIVSGASPEGSVQYNENISMERANAFMSFFEEDIALDLFEVENLGENWAGLYSLVEESSMDYREEVLSVIENISVADGRENKLMQIQGGTVYQYMLKEFFPQLRKASYVQVFYDMIPNENFMVVNQAFKDQDYPIALERLKGMTPTMSIDNLIGVCYMMMYDDENARVYLEKAIAAGNFGAKKNLELLNTQQANIQYN